METLPLFAARAALASLAVLPLAAQVPDGYLVASSLAVPGGAGGGLQVLRPHAGSAGPGNVLGLPTDLTGLGLGVTGYHGANCVLVHPHDGRLLVGEWTERGVDDLEVHEISLAGLSVATARRHLVASASGSAGLRTVDQMAWLPDGRVLLSEWDRNTALARLHVLDLATGVLTALPLAGVHPNSRINALAVTPAGTEVWFVANEQNTVRDMRVYRAPLPFGGQAVLVHTVAGQNASQCAFDDQGRLLLAHVQTPAISRFDGVSWSTVTFLSEGCQALTVDPVSGDALFVSGGVTNQVVERIDAQGQRTVVTNLPATTARLSGFAIQPAMAGYGAATGAAYAFEFEPHPGGLPTLGHGGFALHAGSSSGAAVGALAIGVAATDVPLLGVHSLVSGPLVTLDLPAVSLLRMPLPIPGSPVLIGQRLFLQMFHVRGATLVASRGLRLTIY